MTERGISISTGPLTRFGNICRSPGRCGQAKRRVEGAKIERTSIPDEEWAQVEAEAVRFWDETVAKTPRIARVVSILRACIEEMGKAGRPCRST